MFSPFQILFLSALLHLTSASPSVPTYDETFPSTSNPATTSHQATSYLSLPDILASHQGYADGGLTPSSDQVSRGDCVVVCAMKPNELMQVMEQLSNYDGYQQYACAPSCSSDVQDEWQPVKSHKYERPQEKGASFGPRQFEPDSVVVTFRDIARPGQEGNTKRDGWTVSRGVSLACGDHNTQVYVGHSHLESLVHALLC